MTDGQTELMRENDRPAQRPGILERCGPYVVGDAVAYLPDALGSISLEAVAGGLSKLCRWTGNGPFYCVAQHSIEVATSPVLAQCQLSTFALRRFALLHDAAEIFLGDIPRPTKGKLDWMTDTMEGVPIRKVERFIVRKLVQRFDPKPLPEHLRDAERLVKLADNMELGREALQFFGPEKTRRLFDLNDAQWSTLQEYATARGEIVPAGPGRSKRAFLEQAESLGLKTPEA